MLIFAHQYFYVLFIPGQLKIKYPDVSGDFIFADLVKGGTGLGKLKQVNLYYQSPNVLCVFLFEFLHGPLSPVKVLLYNLFILSFFTRSEHCGRQRRSGKPHFRGGRQARRASGEEWKNSAS